MVKQAIRKMYRDKRMQLTEAEQSRMSDLMLIHFQKLDIDIPALIMTYSPLAKTKEFNVELITDYCYFKNPAQVLFYPVVHEDSGSMSCVVVNDFTQFAPNKYGIDEPIDGLDMFPEEIDLVLIPLLAFDRKGHRVGYGKGYYDRFLRTCRKDVVKIGFSYFDPVEKIEDASRYDVRLNYCITPNDIYRF
jgi:5-formyltetrahydrofolate cyclo-ligase